MGSKLAVILSIGIIFFAFLFGADLVMLQLNYTELDSLSTVISYRISKDATISDTLLAYCEEKNVVIESLNDQETGFQKGDVFTYSLSREYFPLVMSSEGFEVKITRSTVISILN